MILLRKVVIFIGTEFILYSIVYKIKGEMKNSRLKIFRTVAGKTQSQVAKDIGVTQPLICMFEKGKVHPGEELKRRLAAALTCTEEELFPTEGE
jgi:DNA-binding XRE family transcriptional regulator